MKDLKAFVKDLSDDKKLAQKVNKAKTAKEVTDIAADNGYSFDENDLADVSGGFFGPDFDIQVHDLFNIQNISTEIKQNVKGEHNVAQNNGSTNIMADFNKK